LEHLEIGNNAVELIESMIAAETEIKKCSVALGKYNHAILVKDFGVDMLLNEISM